MTDPMTTIEVTRVAQIAPDCYAVHVAGVGLCFAQCDGTVHAPEASAVLTDPVLRAIGAEVRRLQADPTTTTIEVTRAAHIAPDCYAVHVSGLGLCFAQCDPDGTVTWAGCGVQYAPEASAVLTDPVLRAIGAEVRRLHEAR